MTIKLSLFTLLLLTIILSCDNNKRSYPTNQTQVSKKDSTQKQVLSDKHSFHNISGEWYWEGKSDDFTLDIQQQGDSINGTYCAIAQNGNRIDCWDSGGGYCILKGKMTGDTAQVLFNSCYYNASIMDTATIVYRTKNNTLLWTWQGKYIFSFAPLRTVLTKVK